MTGSVEHNRLFSCQFRNSDPRVIPVVGHKSDFDGNSKISSFNLHVYPSVYGSKCFGELQYMPPKGYAEGYHDNTCVLPPAPPGKLPLYGTFGGFGDGGRTVCDGTAKSVATLPENFVLGNNTVGAPSSKNDRIRWIACAFGNSDTQYTVCGCFIGADNSTPTGHGAAF